MELLLLILKIILIALLIVVGVILMLLALILFMPIRYEVSGSIEDNWKINVKGKLTYCLSIFKLLVSYQNGQADMQFYLFGFQKKSRNNEDTDADDIENDNSASVEAENAETAESTMQEKTAHVSSDEESDKVVSAESSAGEEKTSIKSNKKEQQKKKSKFDFVFWKQQLTDAHNQYTVKKIWSELIYLLKHFRFRNIKTNLAFSTGDPASTGQILGVLCMLPILYQYEFKVIPDFESEDAYLKGTFLAVGKIRLIHLLVTVLRLIFDKEVRLVAGNILSKLR